MLIFFLKIMSCIITRGHNFTLVKEQIGCWKVFIRPEDDQCME